MTRRLRKKLATATVSSCPTCGTSSIVATVTIARAGSSDRRRDDYPRNARKLAKAQAAHAARGCCVRCRPPDDGDDE